MAFATLDDLAIRLPGTAATAADLTAKEQAQGEMLLEIASGLVTDAVNHDTAWAASLTPVPAMLRAVTLEIVARVMQNPSGARSESEQLGQYQHSTSFTDSAHGLVITDAEALSCRRSVFGQTSGSATVESLADTFAVNTPLRLDALLEEGPDDPPVYDWTR